MGISGIQGNLSVDALSAYADKTQNDSIQEDQKSNRARRADKLGSHVDAARSKIETNKKAADERLASAKKKTGGMLAGFLIGLLIAVALVVTAFTAGLAAPIAAAVIGLGVAALGAGSSVGGAIGAKTAEGNDKNAEQLTQQASNLELDEKLLDKQQEDIRDMIKDGQEARRQILQDARTRSRERNQSVMG